MSTDRAARTRAARRGIVGASALAVSLAVAIDLQGRAKPGSPAAGGGAERPAPGATEWTWHYRRTPRQIAQLLEANDRIVGIEVDQASPLLLDVAVATSPGREPKGWWWLPGSDGEAIGEDVGHMASRHTARVVALAPYVVGGVTRFAALFVDNGTDAKGWWWFYDEARSQIEGLLAKNGARPVDLRSYAKEGATLYSIVMVPRRPTEQAWWYAGATAETVKAEVKEHGATLASVHPSADAPGTFDVVMTTGADIGTPDLQGVSWAWGTNDSD